MSYYNNDDTPKTFVSSPEFLTQKLEEKSLYGSYLVLKYLPRCDCGKDFRASGEQRAQQQCAQHVGYKKYKDCKPEVIVQDFSMIPEFVTLDQVKGTKANQNRNAELRRRKEKQSFFDDIVEEGYNSLVILDLGDGRYWNCHKGEEVFRPRDVTNFDGYQIDSNINIKGTIVEKGKVRTVNSRKTGEELQVCEVVFEDEKENTVDITLWNGQIQLINKGDKVTITNAYLKFASYSGRAELGLYKNASKITVTEKAQEVVAQ